MPAPHSKGTAMVELILRPSIRRDDRPWALELRVHGPAETSYVHVAHVSRSMAYTLADVNLAIFLYGDPRETEHE